MTRYEIKRRKDHLWWWRSITSGRITGDSGQGFERRHDCVRAAKAHIKSAAKCAPDPDRHIVIIDAK